MIGVLLVTHGGLGQQLIDTVSAMLGGLSLATEAVDIPRHANPDDCMQRARAALARLAGEGVLVLTDAFGSTPSNIANRLDGCPLRVVAGVNLPMLVRIYNYPRLTLEDMAASAVEAGRSGVLCCSDTRGADHG